MNPSPLTRRDFLTRTGVGAAAAVLAPAAFAADAAPGPRPAGAPAVTLSRDPARFPIAAFEKHFFEKYTPEQLAQTADEMDLNIELTVRPDGHIKPENSPDELPRFVEALAKKNRRILVVAASFVRPDEPHIEKTLRTTRQLGIRHYRHRGFKYDLTKPIKPQIANFRSMARDWAAIHKSVGITGLYQNHAGADYVGAAIWDIDQVLDGIDPQLFALALDTRHLVVEQGRAWPSAVKMIAPRVGSLFVKSFRWNTDRPVETPLADGIIKKNVVDAIVAGHESLPVCMHVEHLRLQPVPFAERAATVEAFRADARVLREWLGQA
jgi:hypothetical protein